MPRLHLRTFALAALLVSAATFHAQQAGVAPMDPKAHPKFDIATIKPADPAARGYGFSLGGGTIMVRNEPMREIVAVAYNLHQKQVATMPEWFDQRFDIRGKPDQPGAPSWPQYQEMLRAFLEERVGLTVHHETREMDRFTVTVARGGLKWKPAKETEFDFPDQTGSSAEGKQEWTLTSNSMDDVAAFLRTFLNRPVVNQTGITGKFDGTLKWAREDAPAGTDTGNLPGLLTALQEQAGLKVESAKGPTDVIVIDHVNKPTDN